MAITLKKQEPVAQIISLGSNKPQNINLSIGGAPRATVAPAIQAPVRNVRTAYSRVPDSVYNSIVNSRFLTSEQKKKKLTQLDTDANEGKFNLFTAAKDTLNNRLTGLGLGAVRSLVGTGQGLSGIYDLLTPGEGTNRVSKKLDEAAKFVDETAKNEAVGNIYKAGQVGTDLLTFLVPGAIAKAATKAPAAGKALSLYGKGNKAVETVAAKVASKGTAGSKVAARVIEGATPQSALNIGTGALFDVGTEASKGRDISPADVAASVGLNTVAGVGLPVAGQTLAEGGKAVKKLGSRKTTKAIDTIMSELGNTEGNIDVKAKRSTTQKVTVNKPLQRLDEIREQLNTMPAPENIEVAKFNQRQNYTNTLQQIQKSGYTPEQKQSLIKRVNARYKENQVKLEETLRVRTALDDEASQIKLTPEYQAAHPSDTPVVTTRAVDNTLVQPKQMASSVDNIRTVRGDDELPYKSTSKKSSKPDSLDLLNIKISKVKDPTRKAELVAERARRFPKPEPTVQPDVTAYVPETKHGILQEFKKTQVNDQQVLTDQMRAVDRALGGVEPSKLSKADKFYYLSKMVTNSNTIANRTFESNANVRTALGGMTRGEYKTFSRYANARSELATATGKKTSMSVDELTSIVSSATPEQQARFDALNSYYKQLAEFAHDAGIISDDELAFYVKSGDYLRLQRDLGDVYNAKGGTGRSYNLGKSVVREKRAGSTREAVDAGATAADYTQKVFRDVAKNAAATHIVDTLADTGLATKLSSSAAARNENVIRLFRNGKVEHWRVPKAIKEAADNINPETMNIITRIIAVPGRLFRAGVTGLNPVFIARNLFRDQASSAINSNALLATHNPYAFGEGLMQSVRETVGAGHDDLYELFMRHYGDQTSYDINRAPENARAVVERIRGGKKVSAAQAIKSPIKTLENVASITERSTRFQQFAGTYRKAIKDGMSHEDAMQMAAIAGWRNTVDFGTAGTWGRMLNTVFPYWNPGIQGSAQLIRTFKAHPVTSTFKGIAFIGAPLAAATAWNTSDPDRKAVYDNIPEYDKDNNLILIPPGTEQNEDGSYDVFKVPLPPGFKDLFMPIRRAMESYANDEPQAWGQIATDVIQSMSGPVQLGSKNEVVSTLIPQAAKPVVNQALNKDIYTGKNIVPDYMNTTDANGNPIPENKKAYKDTGTSAQLIANKLGVSPIRVEKFIKDTAGTVGLNIENATDHILNKMGLGGKEDVGGQSVWEGFERAFGKSQGIENTHKTDAEKYYEEREKLTAGLTENEKAAYQALHPSTKNFLGETIYEPNTVYNSAAKLDIYNRFPKTFEVDKKLNEADVKNGGVENPLFSLTASQLKKVLEKANLPAGATDPELSNLYKQDWYKDYQAANQKMYSELQARAKKDGKELTNDSSESYPTASDGLQTALDYYNALPKGTGARSSFITNNPGVWKEMQQYYAQIDDWQNNRRMSRGLDATEGAIGTAAGYGSSSGSYSKYSSGSGKDYFANTEKFRITAPSNSFRSGKPQVSIKERTPSKAKIADGKPKLNNKVSLKKSLV